MFKLSNRSCFSVDAISDPNLPLIFEVSIQYCIPYSFEKYGEIHYYNLHAIV